MSAMGHDGASVHGRRVIYDLVHAFKTKPWRHPSERGGAQRIYFIQAGTSGPIKVGRTTDAYARLRTMQTGNSEELHLLAQSDLVLHPEIAERSLHVTLAAFRLRGEWFRDCYEVQLTKSLVCDPTFWKFVGGAI